MKTLHFSLKSSAYMDIRYSPKLHSDVCIVLTVNFQVSLMMQELLLLFNERLTMHIYIYLAVT